MYKIGILFQDREFEHDIYELIRAFYPEVRSVLSMKKRKRAAIFIFGLKSRVIPV